MGARQGSHLPTSLINNV